MACRNGALPGCRSSTRRAVTKPLEFGNLSAWRDTAGLDARAAREQAARLEQRPRGQDDWALRRWALQVFVWGTRSGT